VCRSSGGIAADEAGKARDGIQAVLDGKSTNFTMEYACHSPTAQRWFSMSVTPLGPAGRGAVVAHTNITERRRVEAALYQSTQRFRDLVDTTDGIVWEADAVTFDFTFVSANAERMLGHPVADWLVPGFWAGHIYPEDREQAIAHCATCTQRLENHEFEYRFIAQSGQAIWVADIVKVVEENGKPRWLRGLMIDISQRKRAEVDLRALSRAIEQSPASIVITDRAGVIEYVNPHFEQVTGYTRAEVIGVNPRVLQSGKTPAQVYQQLWAAITVGGEWRGELCNRRKNGELFWEFAAISGVRGENGEIEHYIAVKADITERKRAQAAHEELETQLRQSQKMEAIGTLAGGIAHDFNNIIATILGNAELARQDLSTNPMALECLEEIRKAGARARDLVQQILSFSRRQATERKRTALTPVVEESARLLRATLSTRVNLSVRCARDVPPVFADATQIEQVVINLVTNAMHAMRGGPGRIDIRLDVVLLDAALADDHPELAAMHARRPGRTVRLVVSDDGAGMEAATLSRIFEPFFTTKPVGEGTGLGLSVVHGIVQAHEGAISVESQPSGGSTFTLYFPPAEALPGVPESDVKAPASGQSQVTNDGHHILYIDDDESLVFLIKRLLEKCGFRISAFTDQLAGLAALRANPTAFDLVVTDYNMPGMSGLDVAREVRAIRADLPVAVASGFIDETLHAQADAAGVQELIFKASAVEDLGEAFARLAQKVAPKSAPRN
jgi:PAS domain S-box-containing protein